MIPVMVFLSFYILTNVNTSRAQWVEINAYPLTTGLNDIQFVNENTGFTVGGFASDTILLKTTNGGLNWERIYLNHMANNQFASFFYRIFFINENIGFLCGGGNYIFKTIDGGLNWTGYLAPFFNVSQIYNDLWFVNENTGFAAGRYGTLAKTTDGGITWDSVYGAISDLNVIRFINESTGFMGDGYSYFYKTQNGGDNWKIVEVVDNQGAGYFFPGMSFINENTGFLCGHNAPTGRSAVFKTINGGNNWTTLFLQFNHSKYYDIRFVNENTGFLITGNANYKTIDGGISWSMMNMNNSNPQIYYRSFFLNENTGYICGTRGNVFKTETGGTNIQSLSEIIPDDFKIKKAYPNPFNSEIKLEISVSQNILINGQEFSYEIFDIRGVLMKKKQLIISQPGIYGLKLNFSENNSGVYFVRITKEDYTTKAFKVVLLK